MQKKFGKYQILDLLSDTLKIMWLHIILKVKI